MNLTKKSIGSFLIPEFLSITVLCVLLCFTISLSAHEHPESLNLSHNLIKADTVITGKITDAKKIGLPGVSVLVKGTQKGTTTDANGDFKLSGLKGTETLTIRYIGFTTQEIPVNGKQSLAITLLEENNNLNEVVVVGYGTQKKATLTGAVVQVKGDIIKQSPNGNLSNNLTGRTPGLIATNRSGEPGNDDSALSIRGATSFSNPNAGPLIVVDGVPDRSFSRINPEDIESVSILKDASAAIYGVRAANGVMLITTKRGKTGKPTVSYNGSVSLQSPTRVTKLVDAGQFARYYNELLARRNGAARYTDEDIRLFENGTDPLGHPNTNWNDVVIAKTAPMTQHDLNVSGGTDNVKYYISGQYLYQKYLYNESPFNYNQKNLRANIDANITKDLKVSLDLSGRNEDKYAPLDNANLNGGVFMAILAQYPTIAAKYPNGLYGTGTTTGSNPLLRVTDQPGYDRQLSYYAQATGTIDLKMPWVTKGLYLNAYAGLDNTFWQYKRLSRPYDNYDYNKTTGEYINKKESTNSNLIGLNETWGRTRRNTYNIKLGYDRVFANDHNVSSIFGYEETDYLTAQTSTGSRSLLSDQLPFLGLANPDPTFLSNSGTGDQNGRRSVFGRVNYTYKDKYLFEFSGRYNGSFNFGPGNKFGFFPGISTGWVMSKENFFNKALPFVSFAKLRGSWGILGDDAINPYLYLSTYKINQNAYYFGNPDVPTLGLATNVSPNPNFTWEKVKSMDLGLELGFFNNTLSFNGDYFWRHRYDILTQRNASIPSYAGLGPLGSTPSKLPPENIGIANSNGFELELNYNGKIGTDFSYTVGGNFTHTNSEIVFMDESPLTIDYQRQTGYPIRSFLIYKADGIYNNQAEIDGYTNANGGKVTPLTGTKPGDIKYIDVNNDGKITSNDRERFFDSQIPRNNFGINLGLRYKGFGVEALFYGVSGVKHIIRPQGNNSETTPALWQYEGRWTPQTPDNNLPAAFDRNSTVNNLDSDFWLNDGSFLRLKTLQLSYDLPKEFLSKIKVRSARVFVNGSNLFVLSKIKNYDPELNYVPSDNNGYYVNGAYYPQTRIIGAGVNVSF
jgi:TonB-linked SusC/RagA family outer membrane protein